MGCGKSKIKRINLTPDNANANISVTQTNGISTISGKVNGVDFGHPQSNGIAQDGAIPGNVLSDVGDRHKNDDTSLLPNRLLLSAIPVSDLGDSLDSRHLSESLNLSQSLGGGFLNHANSRYAMHVKYFKLNAIAIF